MIFKRRSSAYEARVLPEPVAPKRAHPVAISGDDITNFPSLGLARKSSESRTLRSASGFRSRAKSRRSRYWLGTRSIKFPHRRPASSNHLLKDGISFSGPLRQLATAARNAFSTMASSSSETPVSRLASLTRSEKARSKSGGIGCGDVSMMVRATKASGGGVVWERRWQAPPDRGACSARRSLSYGKL